HGIGGLDGTDQALGLHHPEGIEGHSSSARNVGLRSRERASRGPGGRWHAKPGGMPRLAHRACAGRLQAAPLYGAGARGVNGLVGPWHGALACRPMPGLHFIASDVHLGAVPDSTEHAFVAFLRHVGEHGAALLLNGDLFDFWFEYGTVIPGRHFRVLAALADLVDAGIPVTLVGGNHDAWGGRFLREEVGVVFHDGLLRTELAGKPALVAHGDGLGRGDLGYRVLKRVLRSRAAILAFRALHPELGVRLARAVSRTE